MIVGLHRSPSLANRIRSGRIVRVANDTASAAQLLVDCLAEQRVDRIFTVPGESFLSVLDALHDRSDIDTITCRQEGGAAFMACADGALTQRPGIAFVTRGPGATNASIGVHVAHQDSQPMILFVGDVARGMREREGFQEIDFPAFFTPISKWAARIDDAKRIPEYVARAFSVATHGRPGPVVLALPEDMLCDTVPASIPALPHTPDAFAQPCGDLHWLAQRIASAQSPIAIIGGAGWNVGARDAFQSFAEAIGLPVATAFRRQDAISANSPVYAGNLGYGPNPKLLERVRGSDFLLTVGARLGEATTEGYSVPELRNENRFHVHVHPDPEELGSVYPAHRQICCNVHEFAQSCSDIDLTDIPQSPEGAIANEQWQDWATYRAPVDPPKLDMGACVSHMLNLFPKETMICNGAGNFAGWWHRYWRYADYPRQLAPPCGAMGYGVPAALAAALRYPDKQVVAVSGDGDFLMNGQELATAAQYGANLLVLVIDNSAYGTIRMHQEREYPERVSATSLVNPDFAALGASFGAWTASVETTEQFKEALADSRDRKGLRLIHMTIDIEQLAASGATISGLRARA